MINASHVQPRLLGGPARLAPLRFEILPLSFDERVDRGPNQHYVLETWRESYKRAPRMSKMPWSVFKSAVAPGLVAVLERPDTRVLAAYRSDHVIIGWIAYSKLWAIPAVHWVHTRFRVDKGGEDLRRRGVMRALLDAADLGERWVYTHKGPLREFGNDKRTSDERLVEVLGRRGVRAAFVPYAEWSKA